MNIDARNLSSTSIVPFILIGGVIAVSLIYHVLTDPFGSFDPFAFAYPLYKADSTIWETVACAIAFMIVCITAFLLSGRGKKQVYGDAAFANYRELKKLGLFKKSGIVLGTFGNFFNRKAVIFDDNESAVAVMPTGIGKTSGVVIPTCLCYKGSIVTTDIKGEISEATAGFRSQFSDVYIFRFNGKPTNRINMLDYIRWGSDFESRDIDRIAAAYFPPTGEYFEDAPRDLFVALIGVAHALEHVPTTFKTIWMLVNPEVFKRNEMGEFVEPDEDDDNNNVLSLYFKQLVKYAPNLDDNSKRLIKRFANMPYKQLQGVVDTLNKKLTPFRDPLIDVATCGTDIPFDEIRKRRMTIYFEFSVNEYKRYAPIIRTLYEFMQDYLMEELPQNEPHTVLWLLDEFANLGKLHDFSKFVSLSRQYQMQTLAIIQNMPQLSALYEKETNSLMSAFKKQFFSVVNDEETARIISVRAGTTSTSIVSHSGDVLNAKSRQSTSMVSENLVKQYQTYLLDKDKAVLFSEAAKPANLRIIKSWKNKVFKPRLAKSHSIGFQVARSKPVDYSGISHYPCIVDDQQSAIEAQQIPEEFDLSEFQDILDNDPVESYT